jgi:UTP--glucose-1-phosphate uridylyltransferase
MHSLPTIIPAAGFGTRMLPAAKAVPKELLPILDKPTLQYVVEEAVAAGSGDVLLITSRDKRALEDHFDRAPELEARLAATGKLSYLKSLLDLRDRMQVSAVRQSEQLGLGHAVLQARHHVGGRSFLCLLGDTIFSAGAGGVLPAEALVRAHARLPAGSSVIGLERVPREKVSRYGIVVPADGPDASGVLRLTGLVEKPAPERAPSDLAIAARYLLSPDVFDLLAGLKPGAGGELQLTDALSVLAGRGNVYGLVLDSTRHDIGSPEGWLATNLRFARRDPEVWKVVTRVVDELR